MAVTEKSFLYKVLHDQRTVVAASSAAVGSVLAGFPFDSIKQTHNYRSMLDCIRQTYAMEGLSGFFRGIFPPLITVSIIKSISFTTYIDSKKFFRTRLKLDESRLTGLATISLGAGAVAGAAVSIISCPLEIVKIQRQLEVMLRKSAGGGKDGGRTGSWKVAVDIVRRRGVKGLYRGFHLHLLRDAIGTAIYFATYECVKKVLVSNQKTSGPGIHLISGALCGVTSWIFVFPIDLIKSVTQKNVLMETKETRLAPMDIARRIWAKRGFRGLYSGFSSTLARAIPIHSLNWIVYEAVYERLEKL
ncbi:hypothetical protein HDU97_000262 [Phlyctochytrium planicorne]|nr:hypothetical protein HDU97_000262 [Phlyctochytrium planicorne]